MAGAEGGGGGRTRGRYVQEESPRNITALIFHPGSRARRFAPVFNITPRSRMFYPPPPTITFPFPLFLPRFAPSSLSASPCTRCSPYESRGIAPRNEFTILIWRAALAIYYLHGVREKNGDEASAAVEGGQTTAAGWEFGGGVRAAGGPRGRRDNSRGSKIYRIYMRAPR